MSPGAPLYNSFDGQNCQCHYAYEYLQPRQLLQDQNPVQNATASNARSHLPLSATLAPTTCYDAGQDSEYNEESHGGKMMEMDLG